jgi:ribosomal-protein-alanine N-acetyltransferase
MKNPRNGEQTRAAGGLPEGIDIREMTEADLEGVLRIENASYPQPWSRAMFLAEWKGKDYSYLWVAADASSGRPVGHVCFWVLFDELHLLNVAVEPGYRNRGVGRELVRRTLEYGRERGARRTFLEVRASNAAARRLYDGFGFAVSAVRTRYYGAPVEDGLELVLEDLGTNHQGGVKMGNEDKVMEELMKGSFEFRKLYREHVNLDNQVSKMTRRKVLTPEEELHRKQLQVEKLKTKDRMEDMIRARRRSGSPSDK